MILTGDVLLQCQDATKSIQMAPFLFACRGDCGRRDSSCLRYIHYPPRAAVLYIRERPHGATQNTSETQK